MSATLVPHKATALELLSDHGLWLRALHVLSAVAWIGVLWCIDWMLVPTLRRLSSDECRLLWSGLLPRLLWWLRWGAASAWISGMAYASLLGIQSEQGLLGWFHGPLRGRWIGLGFVLATAMVFHVWFVAWPAQARLIAAARRSDRPLDEAWARDARRPRRFASSLSISLLVAMQAGRHGGEISGILPSNFLAAAAVVLALGIALATLIGHVLAPRLGR